MANILFYSSSVLGELDICNLVKEINFKKQFVHTDKF